MAARNVPRKPLPPIETTMKKNSLYKATTTTTTKVKTEKSKTLMNPLKEETTAVE